MKLSKRVPATATTFLCIFALSASPAAFASNSSEDAAENEGLAKIGVELVDAENGEVLYSETSYQEVDGSGTLDVEVTPDAVSEDAYGPFAQEGGTTTNDITSTLTVHYSLDTINQEIRVERVRGGWSNLGPFIVLDREVGLGAGPPNGPNAHWNPADNSFDYYTNWGWYQHYPHTDVSGPGAYSEARYILSGTTGEGVTQTLTVDLPGPG